MNEEEVNKRARCAQVPQLPRLTAAERMVADRYSPFRDPEPPNYLRFMRKIGPVSVRIAVRTDESGRIIEWRGQIPGGNAAFPADETYSTKI